MSPMMVVAIGWMAPAPAPCKARNRISGTIAQARPHRVEATMNKPAPAKNTRFLP